jgi:hypothetical protein
VHTNYCRVHGFRIARLCLLVCSFERIARARKKNPRRKSIKYSRAKNEYPILEFAIGFLGERAIFLFVVEEPTVGLVALLYVDAAELVTKTRSHCLERCCGFELASDLVQVT